MSYTDKQRAYHLRKIRTKFVRMDFNGDGCLSREDFEIMSKRLAEFSGLNDEQAETTREQIMEVADLLGLKPGVNHPIPEAAETASKSFLTMTYEEGAEFHRGKHNMLFDALDTNQDGHISPEEFKVYYQIIAPGTSEEMARHSFDTIDLDKNGEISRQEFLDAAVDFFQGVEETEISKVFFGPLIDD